MAPVQGLMPTENTTAITFRQENGPASCARIDDVIARLASACDGHDERVMIVTVVVMVMIVCAMVMIVIVAPVRRDARRDCAPTRGRCAMSCVVSESSADERDHAHSSRFRAGSTRH